MAPYQVLIYISVVILGYRRTEKEEKEKEIYVIYRLGGPYREKL